MEIRSVGIDLGKTTFHLVALGDNGKVVPPPEVCTGQVKMKEQSSGVPET